MLRNHRTTGALCAAALGLLAGACTDGGTSLIILRNQAPEEGCVVSADEGGTYLPRGRIDVAADEGYLFTPLVQSTAQATSSDGQRIVFVEGADVSITFRDGLFSEGEIAGFEESGLSKFSQSFSGSIRPGGLLGVAFVAVPLQLIDAVAAKIGAGGETDLTAEVTIFGDLDGGDVESQPFRYPITVCDGCLLVDQGECVNLSEDFEAQVGGQCQLLQDAVLDCCTSSAGDFVCPAVPETPPA